MALFRLRQPETQRRLRIPEDVRFLEGRVTASHVVVRVELGPVLVLWEQDISLTTQAGKVITGHYVAEAEFDTGPAQVQIVAVKKGGKWFIQMFRINSMALAGG